MIIDENLMSHTLSLFYFAVKIFAHWNSILNGVLDRYRNIDFNSSENSSKFIHYQVTFLGEGILTCFAKETFW